MAVSAYGLELVKQPRFLPPPESSTTGLGCAGLFFRSETE